ncbi:MULTISPECIES: hypothetical protein [Capnocytophaga]|uniref:hypothetical protein n=1 Tax=Capnocytophaga TaxID=1016 RepID=UPI001562D639|nr:MULTISPECIES: hypothetical protein [Capnocytophaga]
MKTIRKIWAKLQKSFTQVETKRVYCLEKRCYATAVYVVYFGVFVSVKYMYNL